MDVEQIFSFENLYNAYKKCRLSKQHKGEVIRFEMDLSNNLNKLMKKLYSKKYELGNYRKFYIYELKERFIEALPFKDRVVVRCFCDNSLKPKLDKRLIYDNAACRCEKGTLFAINRLHRFMRREYKKHNRNDFYFLKCDIKKYFQNINHEILFNLLKQVPFSKDELWFIDKTINTKNNNLEKGLPLGNQTSQWYALFYLNKVDRLIKEKYRIKNYIRYMDDMILISSNKDELRMLEHVIKEYCKKNLKLELNSKTMIGKIKNGVDFLGYNHLITPTGKILMKLRQSSLIRMKKHVKTIKKLRSKNLVDDEYVLIRKNSFYQHLKRTCGLSKFKVSVKYW